MRLYDALSHLAAILQAGTPPARKSEPDGAPSVRGEPPFKIVIECRDMDTAVYMREFMAREAHQISYPYGRATLPMTQRFSPSSTIINGDVPFELRCKF